METGEKKSSRRNGRTTKNEAVDPREEVASEAPGRHRVISASAGSGKTYQLSNRYLQLLVGSAPIDSILAATFTRKAAGEIQSRIMLRLAKGAESEDECRKLSEALGAQPALSVERCRELLRTAADRLHRLRIGTLDSFFAQLASGFSLELGLPVGWRIVEADEEKRQSDEALHRVLAREATKDVLSLLNLLNKGETGRSVVGVLRSTVEESYTLFRDSPAEAWTRLERPHGLSAESVSAALAELRAIDLSKDSRMAKARSADADKIEASDWGGLIDGGLAAKIIDRSLKYYSKEIPAPVVAVYERLLQQAASELVGQTVFQTRAAYDWLSRYHVELEKLKQEGAGLRFDDISFGLGQLGADNERLAWRLDGAIDHLLLDEFQDTSLTQWGVMRPLAERLTTAGLDRGAFFCVGDIKQAIYGWRGGVARLLEMLDGELPNLEREELTASRRSSPVVIDVVNRVFQNLDKLPCDGPMAAGLSQWQEAFPTHSTTRENLPGYVVLETSDAAAEGQTQQQAAFDFAAQKIRDLLLAAPGRSIGVLTRTNEAVSQLVFHLQKLGAPASEEGGQPLVDSPAVELILSLLRLIDHPGDTIARYHVARSAMGEALGFTDWREVWPSTELGAKLRRELHEQGYGATIGAWAAMLDDCCEARDRQRLRQLVDLAYEYRPSVTCRPTDFVARIEARKVAEPSAAPVRVMTVHQAKGLEFDIVVLPELDKDLKKEPKYVVHRATPIAPVECVSRYVNQTIQQLFPAERRAMFDSAIENQVGESLCMLYVALTRARHALHMVIAPSKPNENTIPKKFAGMLRTALHGAGRVAPRQVLFESGDANWASSSEIEVVGEAFAISPAGPTRIEFRSSTGIRRHLTRRSPSSLEGGERVKLAPIIERTEGNLGLQFGKVIHGWFELIEWLDDGAPSEAKRLEVAALCEAAAVLPQARKAFDEMLARPEISAALRRAAYGDALQCGWKVEVRNEFPFAYRDGETLISGSIDRLVRIYDGEKLVAAEIIDYKTDDIKKSGSKSLKNKVDYYGPQVAAYRRAVASMTGLDSAKISAKLLFVGLGIVQEISP